MQLYIEYVLLDNIVIDYILIRLIEKTTGEYVALRNKIFDPVLGAVLAIFLPFVSKIKGLCFLYKMISSIIVVLCIRRYKNIKKFITYYLLFITYTFLIGGAILWLIQILNIEYSMSGLFMYKFEFPLGIFAIIVLILIKLLYKSIELIKSKLASSNYMYTVAIYDGGKKIKASALFDSGNNVVFENRGVNIISIGMFLMLYNDIDLQLLFDHKINNNLLKGLEFVEIKGIGGGEKYITFVIDSLEVGGVKYPMTRVAVAMKNFGNYDCILHKDFVGGKL